MNDFSESRQINEVAKVVEDFGLEWSRFDQSELSKEEVNSYFEEYFSIFPWSLLPQNACGFDLGCGSGRWARFVAQRVGNLHCIDASPNALLVAQKNLADMPNIDFICASVSNIPLDDNSMDFGYSLGVLHHVPDTASGLANCVKKLRPGAPFLVYLYYAFDNRPLWFRMIWKISDLFRTIISRLPVRLKFLLTDLIAILVYWPLARLALVIEKIGINPSNIPLSYYRNRAFYTMRTDALDRFGTSLEKRYSKAQIQQMMESSGLRDITFREAEPFWCAVGFKTSN